MGSFSRKTMRQMTADLQAFGLPYYPPENAYNVYNPFTQRCEPISKIEDRIYKLSNMLEKRRASVQKLYHMIRYMHTNDREVLIKAVSQCAEYLIPKFGITQQITIPPVFADDSQLNAKICGEDVEYYDVGVSYYDVLENIIHIESTHPSIVGEETGHWLYSIVNPDNQEISKELANRHKEFELSLAADRIMVLKIISLINLHEAVGRYAALSYINYINDRQSLRLCFNEIEVRDISVRRDRLLYLIEPDEEKEKTIAEYIKNMVRVYGHLAAASLFEKYGDSKLTECARTKSWEEVLKLALF